MLAPSKRRASFYTLPIVVLIGFLIVAGLVAWQRAEAIADLSAQIAHGEQAESTAAVRKLAAIPNPPLSVLVRAATSDERATAEAAQVAINRLLDKWQQQCEKQQQITSVAGQVTELAAALADQRRAFGADDYPWLMSVTRKVVQLALKCPAKKTPLVALHCDEVMSFIERHNSSATFAGRGRPSNGGQQIDSADAPAESEDRGSQRESLERSLSVFPTEQFFSDDAVEPQLPLSNEASSSIVSSADLGRSSSVVVSGGQDLHEVPGGDASEKRATAPFNSPLRPDRSLSMLRILPAAPTNSAAEQSAAPKLAPPNVSLAAPEAHVTDSETRKLLARWLAAKGEETQFVAHDLATRGFKRLPRQLVEQCLSTNVEDRLHLVDSVLTEPGVDARPWLILLSDDESAEVRLLAVTIMATSDDKTLVEKAWQVAIRDRDPRIAELATRLRERRGGALLR